MIFDELFFINLYLHDLCYDQTKVHIHLPQVFIHLQPLLLIFYKFRSLVNKWMHLKTHHADATVRVCYS